eukprot:CAMPEP_0116843138 /NCGR_PEP_ID=MMETSP0418-20121206/11917_1 /TAXON_ID=1158023 /ORGANISM="Astrosyne radiata, Strain 13vi08-1A" /LENGTH=454 /DNA_ID=CAMNT_0004473849 /DNA_START=512 /DNA_END=1876 /DNA_ORIENTATION=-
MANFAANKDNNNNNNNNNNMVSGPCIRGVRGILAVTKIGRKDAIGQPNNEEPKYEYDGNDIKVGKILGQGGFGCVAECTFRRRARRGRRIIHIRLAVKSLKEPSQTTEINNRNGDTNKSLDDEEQEQQKRQYERAVESLVREIRFLKLLQPHPHIVRFVGASSPDLDRPFLIMERLEETFRDRIITWSQDQSRRLVHPLRLWNDRLIAALGVAEGLRFMYEERGIVHRDIKPGNVGFDSNGTPKIFDLGLAKKLMDDHDTYRVGKSLVVGSVPYMAPEMARGEQHHDPSKADVYSFGMMLWEMFALQGRPFWNYEKDEWIEYVVNGHHRPMCGHIQYPVALSMLFDLVEQFLHSCWHMDPDHRPSWDEVVCGLDKLQCYVQHELHQQVSEVLIHHDTHQLHESIISQVARGQQIQDRRKSFVLKRILTKAWKRGRRVVGFGPQEGRDAVSGADR